MNTDPKHWLLDYLSIILIMERLLQDTSATILSWQDGHSIIKILGKLICFPSHFCSSSIRGPTPQPYISHNLGLNISHTSSAYQHKFYNQHRGRTEESLRRSRTGSRAVGKDGTSSGAVGKDGTGSGAVPKRWNWQWGSRKRWNW